MQDLKVVRQTINELVNGIGISDIKIKTGSSAEEVKEFGLKVQQIIDAGGTSNEKIKVEWDCDEMQLTKSLLCELFKELDHFEFQTRLGFSEDEVWGVLKTVRENLDAVCYPK